MFVLALYLFIPYLIYNIIVGSILALQYYSIEDEVRSDEFLVLWFLPVIGLGKWKYNQILRWGEEPEYPSDWYKYKYIKNLHWGFVAVFAFVCFIAISGMGSMVGEGTKAAEETGHASAIGFGLLFDIGAAIFEGMFLIIVFLFIVVLGFVFIFYPYNKMREIERDTYKRKFYKKWNDAAPKNNT